MLDAAMKQERETFQLRREQHHGYRDLEGRKSLLCKAGEKKKRFLTLRDLRAGESGFTLCDLAEAGLQASLETSTR